MELLFRQYKERSEVAMFIRQRDIHKLTGLRGKSAHYVMAADGWTLGVWTTPPSRVRFKGYRRLLSIGVQS